MSSSVKYDGRGERDPTSVRWVDPPREVEALVGINRWRLASLDLWLREPDGWYGHVRVPTIAIAQWKPSKELRLPSMD